MNKTHNPDDNLAFKPPHFLFYYMQRVFIWGSGQLPEPVTPIGANCCGTNNIRRSGKRTLMKAGRV
jgi:hypothetical protein